MLWPTIFDEHAPLRERFAHPGRHARGSRNVGVLGLSMVAALVGAPEAAAYPNPFTPSLLTGGPVPAPDPTLLLDRDPTVYLYATGNLAYTSTDTGATYAASGSAEPTQSWWANYNSGSTPLGPDVSNHGGTYWMYYDVKEWGSQHSAIGLATSSSGQPGTWKDAGSPVLTSNSGMSYVAEDPHSFIDPATGQPWLTFGGWYKNDQYGNHSGIWMVSVDSTGRPNSTPIHIAENAGPIIEGSDLIEDDSTGTPYYYLFFSHGTCCDGFASTYDVRVGRSTSPTGPFYDKSGVNLLQGGGTVVLAGHDYVVGPGGEFVYWDPHWNHLEMAYHYWDTRYAESTGRVLGVDQLYFDASGWPYL